MSMAKDSNDTEGASWGWGGRVPLPPDLSIVQRHFCHQGQHLGECAGVFEFKARNAAEPSAGWDHERTYVLTEQQRP